MTSLFPRGRTGQTFYDVAVGLPSKVRGSEAEEEWQEVDWITWSTGEIKVESDFLLVFKPTDGGGTVKSKPLGHLIRAGGTTADDTRTLVVTTSDALHRLYRFTFPPGRHAADFAALAVAAEAAESARAKDSGTPTSVPAGKSQLEVDLMDKLSARQPLVYGGAELYGPDPRGDQSTEVLLGRGAFVLLDPPEEETNRVGSHELLFYSEDEGTREPLKRLAIGQRMPLKAQPLEEADDPDGPAASFELPALVPGARGHVLTFDSAAVAAAFRRDYRVRQNLMELALATVKGKRAANELTKEIDKLKQQALTARLTRFLMFVTILIIIAVFTRLAMLYAKDKKQPLAVLVKALGLEIKLVASNVIGTLKLTGSKVCEILVDTVPSSDLRRCLALPSSTQFRQCVEALAGPA